LCVDALHRVCWFVGVVVVEDITGCIGIIVVVAVVAIDASSDDGLSPFPFIVIHDIGCDVDVVWCHRIVWWRTASSLSSSNTMIGCNGIIVIETTFNRQTESSSSTTLDSNRC